MYICLLSLSKNSQQWKHIPSYQRNKSATGTPPNNKTLPHFSIPKLVCWHLLPNLCALTGNNGKYVFSSGIGNNNLRKFYDIPCRIFTVADDRHYFMSWNSEVKQDFMTECRRNKMAAIFIMPQFEHTYIYISLRRAWQIRRGNGCDNGDEFSGSLAFMALLLLLAAWQL